MKDRQGRIIIANQDGFGDFEFEPAGRQAGCRKSGGDFQASA